MEKELNKFKNNLIQDHMSCNNIQRTMVHKLLNFYLYKSSLTKPIHGYMLKIK
jgi:hypothetical protein